jgi:predicted DNA binding CopG/RHH family protein
MSKYDPEYIDQEERELLEDIENIDPKTLPRPTETEQKVFKKAAQEYLAKETKMNIRIDPYELDQIKKQAKKEGLRYQTFIKSILHKYMTGQLIERDGKAS